MRPRALWAAAIVALAAYVAGWLALGSYAVTRIADDGIALLVVTAVAAIALACLVLVDRPATLIACGLLLVLPLACPVGVVSAWFLVTGVFGPPHSLLQALHVGRGARAVLAFGFLVAVPVLAGCLFLLLGRRRQVPAGDAVPHAIGR